MLDRYGENSVVTIESGGEPFLSNRARVEHPRHWEVPRPRTGRSSSTVPFRRLSVASNSEDGTAEATPNPTRNRPRTTPRASVMQLKPIKHVDPSTQSFLFTANSSSNAGRPTSLSDASDTDWDANKARRNRRKLWLMCEAVWRLISVPVTTVNDKVMSTCKTYRRIRNAHKDFYEMDYEMRLKAMFMLSTLLGGTVFLLIFEAMHMTFSFYLEDMDLESIWMLAYVMAYVVSIIWQHSLNQCLVFPTPAAGYCESLCLTFSVYAVTLLMTTLFGAFLMTYLHLSDHPQIVMVLTLPISGVINFYLLRWSFDYSATSSKDWDIVIL